MNPSRELTLVFTDIEGSTRMWEQHGELMSVALAEHDQLVRAAFREGTIVKSMGDGVLATFAEPAAAVAAACELQAKLRDPEVTRGMPLRVRCGVHVGAVELRDDDCYGPAVNRTARIMAAAHGGQVLLSGAAAGRVRDALPASVSLRDLGKVRLKDLADAEQLFQLVHPALPSEFPPLRSLASIPNNLRQQTTSFVGREHELREVAELLGRGRLLTLVGSGGCGKTRLAMQVAANVLDDFVDGVWLVELAAISDGTQVASTIASVMGLREEASRSALKDLVAYLRDKRVLVLLDNCEHVLDGGARVAEAILAQCPGVVILATSREGLGIKGERSYRVPSLTLPDASARLTADSITGCEAVQLLADRASLVRHDFAVTDDNAASVSSICRRLDGIPLALELAAARIRTLSIEEIERRLDQRFRLLTGGTRGALPRQQTLRSTMDWSYELLNDVERLLFVRLAVFSGGFTLEAVEHVCAGDTVAADAVLDLVTALVDKSLVTTRERGGHTRYVMLETVRQYARELLVDSGAVPALFPAISPTSFATPKRPRTGWADRDRRMRSAGSRRSTTT